MSKLIVYFRVEATTPSRWTMRRCSIHDRPTCQFSADDGAYAGHWKAPRSVSCEINSRFRRFGCGTALITGLNMYYIGFLDPKAPPGNPNSRAHNLINSSELLEPATISPCTITMDHDAIIFFMID